MDVALYVSNLLVFFVQALTTVLYRSHRMASGGWPRRDLRRSPTRDATTCEYHTGPARLARTAMPRAEPARLGQRGRSRVRDRPVGPTDGAVPAE